MKHLYDAQQFLKKGESQAAMTVLENLLDLAPRNPEALRLKALILDSWGRFDESLATLHNLSQMSGLTQECASDIERRAFEEKEAVVYSELSSEGRWYFAFPAIQVWISLYGFLGCAFFLLLSPNLLSQGNERFSDLMAAFLFFVVMPWIGLMIVHFTGIKKILVGINGVKICSRLSEINIRWDQINAAVVEHDPDILKSKLSLILYSKESPSKILYKFDVSKKGGVVRARRHFVRSILNYVDTVIYIPTSQAVPLNAVNNKNSDQPDNINQDLPKSA